MVEMDRQREREINYAENIMAGLLKGFQNLGDSFSSLETACKELTKQAAKPLNKAKHFIKSKKKRTREKYEKTYRAFARTGFS